MGMQKDQVVPLLILCVCGALSCAITVRAFYLMAVIMQLLYENDLTVMRKTAVDLAIDLTVEAKAVEREMALVKVAGTGDKRVEALRLSDAFRARVIDTTHSSFVFEVTGAPDKIDAFIGLMRPLGLVDVSRTGVVAIARGPEAM